LQFHHSTLVLLRIEFYDFSYLFSTGLSWYKGSGCEFDRFVWVDLSYFLDTFCYLIFFSNSCFNIGFVEHWVSWFFFTCFLWVYFNFITRDKLTQVTCLKIIKIQIILQNNFKEIQMRVQEFWKAWITLNDFFKIYKYI
jgi:hypothetical protein